MSVRLVVISDELATHNIKNPWAGFFFHTFGLSKLISDDNVRYYIQFMQDYRTIYPVPDKMDSFFLHVRIV
jgi:hypothetical protein